MRAPTLFQVTRHLSGEDPHTTVTDAAGVTELVHRAAATGARVHIRPLPDGPDDQAGPRT